MLRITTRAGMWGKENGYKNCKEECKSDDSTWKMNETTDDIFVKDLNIMGINKTCNVHINATMISFRVSIVVRSNTH